MNKILKNIIHNKYLNYSDRNSSANTGHCITNDEYFLVHKFSFLKPENLRNARTTPTISATSSVKKNNKTKKHPKTVWFCKVSTVSHPENVANEKACDFRERTKILSKDSRFCFARVNKD